MVTIVMHVNNELNYVIANITQCEVLIPMRNSSYHVNTIIYIILIINEIAINKSRYEMILDIVLCKCIEIQ